MRELHDFDKIYTFCKALSSPIRVEIVRYLTQNRSVNLNELAEYLNVTNGALTTHIKILSEAQVIRIENTAGKRGLQKQCFLMEHKYFVNLASEYTNANMYQVDIPVGTYTDFEASPTCGISTPTHIIGEVDDPRYFDDPQRVNAGIVWLTRGYIVYKIPNYLKVSNTLDEIYLSFEISSEAPGVCDDWPSDINFYLNDTHLGYWTCPGDFGNEKGTYTPDWWYDNWNQYGLLKLLVVNKDGSFVDGKQISNVTISDLKINYRSELIFKFEVESSEAYSGGLTLFGKGFGNYNQDINVKIVYK